MLPPVIKIRPEIYSSRQDYMEKCYYSCFYVPWIKSHISSPMGGDHLGFKGEKWGNWDISLGSPFRHFLECIQVILCKFVDLIWISTIVTPICPTTFESCMLRSLFSIIEIHSRKGAVISNYIIGSEKSSYCKK